MGIHTNDFATEMQNLCKAVHDEASKICIQLVHAGGQADTQNAGRQPVAPSAVKVDQYPEMPAGLTIPEIKEIAASFAQAARRAKDWGFDAVQIHGAHGYLVNQFLSPHTNLRNDDYGGDIENRCRFMLEVYQQIRDQVGAEYPVLIKLNSSDNLKDGFSIEDSVYAAKKLSDAGIDAIEVSGGTAASGDKSPVRQKINKPEKEAYHLELALRIKEAVNCSIMVVGGFRSYEIAEKAVTDDGMDYISMARPLIREPELPKRWQQNDHSPAKCISCNKCFIPGFNEGGIYCVTEKKQQERKQKKETSE